MTSSTARLSFALTAERRNELDLGSGEVEAGGRHEEARDLGRLDAVVDRDVVEQHVVHRGVEGTWVDPESGRGVPLRIEIDDQNSVVQLGE